MEDGGEGEGEGEEQGEWEQVGPKNKSTITRQVSRFVSSLVPRAATIAGLVWLVGAEHQVDDGWQMFRHTVEPLLKDTLK